MRVWIVEIGEPLPIEEDPRLLRYGNLCETLDRLGHETVWWTSTFLHAKKEFVGQSNRVEKIGKNTELQLIHGPGYKSNVSLARIRHQRDFAKKYFEAASQARAPDVILSPIPTIETAHASLKLAKKFGVPLVIDIRDEWPQEFVNLAPHILRPIVEKALSGQFDRVREICSSADAILGMSEKQLNYGLKYSGRERGPKDGMFPHGYRLALPSPERIQKAKDWWLANGVDPEKKVVCFFGTIGKFFDLEIPIRAVAGSSQFDDVQLVLCGDGPHRSRYIELAAGSKNVLFPGWVDASKIAGLMELASVGLAPYRSGEGAFSLPNKPFEYMAGSLPILSSIQGELKSLLSKNRCGVTYVADDPVSFSQNLEDVLGDLEEAKQMGKRSRELLENQFSAEELTEKMARHLEDIANAKGSSSGEALLHPKADHSHHQP